MDRIPRQSAIPLIFGLSHDKLGIAYILGASTCFGAMGIAVKMVRWDFNPMMVAHLRFVFQFLALLPWFILTGQSLRKPNQRFALHCWRSGLGVGTIVFFYTSLTLIPVGLTSLLAMTSIGWATFFARWVFQERVSGRQMVFGAFMVFGVAVTIMGKSTGQWGWSTLGVGLALCGGLVTGVSRTLVKHMRRYQCPPQEVVFYFGLLGAIFTAPSYYWQDSYPTQMKPWLIVLVIGVLGTSAQILMTTGFRYTKMFTAGASQLAGTMVTVMLGMLILNEVPNPSFYFGSIFVGAGILGMMSKLSKTKTVSV